MGVKCVIGRKLVSQLFEVFHLSHAELLCQCVFDAKHIHLFVLLCACNHLGRTTKTIYHINQTTVCIVDTVAINA